jgi:hypothetical protein
MGLPVLVGHPEVCFLRRRTREPKSASLCFYPVGNFHEIDGFWTIVQKPEVMERIGLGGNVLCPDLYPKVYG